MSGNFFTDLHAPSSDADPEAKTCVESGAVTQCENGWGSRSGTVVSQEGQPQPAIPGTLIGQQAKDNIAAVHGGFQRARFEAALEEQAPGTFA
jgi:hypothetical protein